MADIRCPSCGKDNPDFLDRCQFCQTPLKSESMLHIGESPTKKNTGELESVLPEWLRDLRQQAKQSAEENAAQEAAQSKTRKEEPPDLLAGLASQAGADEDELPDWLASLGPAGKVKSSQIPAPPAGEDFFAQFDQGKSETSVGPVSEPSQADTPSRGGDAKEELGVQEEKDELSEWFSQASEQPSEPFTFESGTFRDDRDWASNLASYAKPSEESVPPKEEEDLSWLYDLEASAKQSAAPPAPQQESSWKPDAAPAGPLTPQEDLSWLDDLGVTPGPSQPAQPSTPQEDLSWLNDLGSIAESSEQGPAKPSMQEDLSWLKDLSTTPEPSQTKPAAPSAQDDLSSLQAKQGVSESSTLASPVISPRRTAPLSEEAESESVPDWLKSATEEPSMPPLGAGALDWFASHDLEKHQLPAAEESSAEKADSLSEETPSFSFDQTQEAPVSAGADIFIAPSESPPASNQDVDSLFSIDIPDWLSQPEPAASDASLKEAPISSTEGAESLAPVELPSWVQAMRPVEAVISETASGAEDQLTESEGPLAGLSGVIPRAPIGSSQRPKAIALKLQATNEQQASAALLQEMLAAETSPRSPVSSSLMMPQRVLRWVLTGLFVVVLGVMIGLRSQSLPVSAALPVEVGAVSNAVVNIPESAPVLVIVDYGPSLAGEMEAASGPLLNQIVILRRAIFSFLSTSPNGSALVERLMTNTRINRPAPDGLGYQSGDQYFNLGYLPGGSAGVLAFIGSPQTAIPAGNVENFSQYAAVIVLTDRAESGRLWVEQRDARKQSDPALASQSLLMVASAQAGPLLQPYVSSRQVTGMISGLSDAARYEFVNNAPPGIARSYWDAFGIGLLLAIILITFGSLWGLFTRIRPPRAGAEQG